MSSREPQTTSQHSRRQYNGALLRGDISLARLTKESAAAMYRWMQDPEVAGNIGLSKEPTLERTLEWIERQEQDASIEAFAIVFGGQHVGNVVLDQIDPHHGTARFSIYIGEPEARGGGVGTAAAFLALEYGFLKPGLEKIWLTVHVKNVPAIRSYTRLGFAREGLLRGEFVLGGERLSLVYMGILRSEFLALVEGGGAVG